MEEIVRFKFNKFFVYSNVFGILFIIIILGSRALRLDDSDGKRILFYFCIVLLFFLIYIVIKFFVPVIKNEPALELHREGILDNVRHRFCPWENIKEIGCQSFGKGNSGIAVYLIDKKIYLKNLNSVQKIFCKVSSRFYNTPFIIPFQYISGDNSEILDTCIAYFQNKKKQSEV